MIGFIKTTVFSLILGLGALSVQAAQAGGCIEEAGGTITFRLNGQVYLSDRITDYLANIAPRDLYNSRGVRLGDVGAILQQDRANLHKTGMADGSGDFVDLPDNYFTSLQRRRLLSTAPRFYYCNLSRGDIARIEEGILNARLSGLLWVSVFRLPDGRLALALSVAG